MRKTLLMLILCIAGAFLNIIFNKIAGKMFLPLYLDTVLTITVTLMGGPVWGSATGALTNFVSHTFLNFWGWEGYLFALCSIATALITWLFMRFFPNELSLDSRAEEPPKYKFAKSQQLDKMMNRIFVLTLLGFALCLAMSVLGGFITFLIEIIRTSTGDILEHNPASVMPTMFQRGIPFVLREILSRIPINIIDRLISVFVGFGIHYLVSPFKRNKACARKFKDTIGAKQQ